MLHALFATAIVLPFAKASQIVGASTSDGEVYFKVCGCGTEAVTFEWTKDGKQWAKFASGSFFPPTFDSGLWTSPPWPQGHGLPHKERITVNNETYITDEASALAAGVPSCSGVQCHKWPVFESEASLKADAWGEYYKTVYGELPSTGYPINTQDNWLIYDSAIASSHVTRIPKSVGLCPGSNPPEGQRYSSNNIYEPRSTSWIWHPYPYYILSGWSWVEVIHQKDPFGDEQFGMWFLYAPGSGVYFNLGTSISFAEHDDAYTHFGINSGDLNENLAKAAVDQGYDSVQFLAHFDHTNYKCDTGNTNRAGLDYMGVEVLGVKLVGTYPCGASSGAPAAIKAGWRASRACVCDNSRGHLNCQGMPSLQDKAVNGSLGTYNV